MACERACLSSLCFFLSLSISGFKVWSCWEDLREGTMMGRRTTLMLKVRPIIAKPRLLPKN